MAKNERLSQHFSQYTLNQEKEFESDYQVWVIDGVSFSTDTFSWVEALIEAAQQ